MNRFRPISPDDYRQVADLLRQAFVAPSTRFGVSSSSCPVHPAMFDVARIEREIAAGRQYFVAEGEDLIAGVVALHFDNDGTAEISRLAVRPKFIHQGIGTMLIKSVLEHAAPAPLIKAHVYARHSELIRWFAKRGFALLDAFEVHGVATPIAKLGLWRCGPKPATIRVLAAGDESALEKFLLARIDGSAMLLSNLRNGGIEFHGRPRQATYIAAEKDGEILGVLGLCWNGMILPQAPQMIDELARTGASVFDARIDSVVGLERQVSRIAQILALPTGRDSMVMMDSHEILYSLDIASMKTPAELISGEYKVRRVEPRDLPVLVDWMVDFNLESMGRRTARTEVQANLTRASEERDNRWVLESRDGLLATTGFSAATREVVQVGGVYTPPELRGRRYARVAVAGSLLDAKAQGVPLCVLFTAETNISAQRSYEALGFVRKDRFRLLFFREAVRARLNASRQ